MRAVVKENGKGSYDVRFTGRFAVIIPFTYKATLVPQYHPQSGTVQYHSSKYLGPILGSYTMNAAVDEPQFVGRFQAAGDTGSVRMQRVR